MRKLFLLSVVLIVSVHIAGAESIITIDILENNSALWTIEKRVPITTQEEINDWNEFVQKGHNYRYQKDLEEFRNLTDTLTSSAQNFTNRSMSTENFNITYELSKTLSGTEGIVSYSFEWNNFSHTESSRIFIGDAFAEGTVLSSDNVLIVKIPEGYVVQNVTPGFDRRAGNLLIWDGTMYHNFSNGEPAIILSPSPPVPPLPPADGNEAPQLISISWPVIIYILIAIIAGFISIVLLILWKKRRSLKSNKKKIEFYEDILKQVPKEFHELLKVPGIYPKLVQFLHKEHGLKGVEELERTAREHRLRSIESDAVLSPHPDLTTEDLRDEELIEQYLLKSGGQAYQSDIVKESGFSKSKISILLANMKEEGRIIKIKKGKENLIRIASQSPAPERSGQGP